MNTEIVKIFSKVVLARNTVKIKLLGDSITHGVGGSGYREIKTPIAAQCFLAGNDYMGGSFVTHYSKAVEFSADGKLALKDPVALNLSVPVDYRAVEAYANAILSHAPCYIRVEDQWGIEDPAVYFIPEGATYTYGYGTNGTLEGHEYPADNDGDGYEESSVTYLILQGANAAAVPASTVSGEYYELPPGEIVLEHSADRNAYPDSGVVGDTEYKYLGIPFEKLPFAARCETGSYNGTGTYGASKPTKLTFAIQPKFVMVYTKARTALMNSTDWYKQYALFLVNGTSIPAYYQSGASSYSQTTISYSMNGNELSWYLNANNTYDSSDRQFNQAGTTYYYIAIG